MKTGRPLRFLTMTMAGWTALRVAMLWPDAVQMEQAAAAAKPLGAGRRPALAHAAPVSAPFGSRPALPDVVPAAAVVPGGTRPGTKAAAAGERAATRPVAAVAAPSLAMVADQHDGPAAAVLPPPLRPTPLASAPGRFAGSVWVLTRGGSGGTLLGGRIGGSQAGARITYALGQARRLALAARIATPLSGRGREAAVGIEWKPTSAPVRLVAEQRFGLDGNKGGPTLMAIGGVGPVPLAAGFRLESYAQAGAIARDRVEGFADGAARVTRVVAAVAGATLDAGIGSWGAAQRGAARLDIGPSLGLAVPVGRRSLRLTLDYRERVAGAARPGSGVALSLGSDF